MEYKDIAGRMPEKVFQYFKAISDIPRGTGNTKAVSDYCMDFAKERGLSCFQDDAENVVILKEATPGSENAPCVMIQGHLDMVCVKENGVIHDFEKDGIRLILDGDYIRADGTTLGADDGIAVAYGLAILDSDYIPHPKLECVFTTGEEIGLVGASALDMSRFEAKYLLNLDSEEEGRFLAGCAGGIHYDITVPLSWERASGFSAEICLEGLKGGHSGVDIHEGRANANMLLGRIFDELSLCFPDIKICSASGGTQDNAIPRASSMKIIAGRETCRKLPEALEKLETVLKAEYRVTDPHMTLTSVISDADREAMVLTQESADIFKCFLLNIPDGVQAMSQEKSGFPETSLNLGIMSLTEEKGLIVSFLLRSASDSRKHALGRRLETYAEHFGGTFNTAGNYPAWEYRPDSPFRDLVCSIYEEQYGKKAIVEIIHAGVECGLFSAGIKDLDAVAMGPEMLDIHTPKERICISSVDRVWNFVLEVLKRMKNA